MKIVSEKLSSQLAYNLLNYFIEPPFVQKVEIFFYATVNVF